MAKGDITYYRCISLPKRDVAFIDRYVIEDIYYTREGDEYIYRNFNDREQVVDNQYLMSECFTNYIEGDVVSKLVSL